MKFCKHLYISDQLIEYEDRIKDYLQGGKFLFNLYVIAIPEQGNGQLEIYQSNQFLQKAFPTDHLYIAGFSRGYSEALGLVEKIVAETFEKTGTYYIKKYLKQQEQDS